MLLRGRNIGKCSCKVGSCRKCGSACRRCLCDCDGIKPIDALKRSRGRPRQKKIKKSVPKKSNSNSRSPVKHNLCERKKKSYKGTNLRDAPNEKTGLEKEVCTFLSIVNESNKAKEKGNSTRNNNENSNTLSTIRNNISINIGSTSNNVDSPVENEGENEKNNTYMSVNSKSNEVIEKQNTPLNIDKNTNTLSNIQNEAAMDGDNELNNADSPVENGKIIEDEYAYIFNFHSESNEVNEKQNLPPNNNENRNMLSNGHNEATMNAENASNNAIHQMDSMTCSSKSIDQLRFINNERTKRKLCSKSQKQNKKPTRRNYKTRSAKKNNSGVTVPVLNHNYPLRNITEVSVVDDLSTSKTSKTMMSLPEKNMKNIRTSHRVLRKRKAYMEETSDTLHRRTNVSNIVVHNEMDASVADSNITDDNTDNKTKNSKHSLFVPQLPKIPNNIMNESICLKPFVEDVMCNNLTKIGQLLDYFNLPDHYKYNLPSLKLRGFSETLASKQFSRFRRMVTMVSSCVEKICLLLCPGPSRVDLLKSVATNIKSISSPNLITTVINEDQPKKDYQQMFERLSQSVCVALKGQKKRTNEKRVLSAVLYDGTSASVRSELLRKHNFKFAKGQPEKQARTDFETLKLGNTIEKTVVSYSSKSDEVIKKAVDFILSEQFTSPTSFGEHDVVIGRDEKICFPNIMRRQSRSSIIKAYLNETQDDSQRLGKNTMFQILNSVTTTDEKVLSAIDYVTSILVNDTCETLQTIIDKCVSIHRQPFATSLVLTSRTFLKHQYCDHIAVENDDICSHSFEYGLKTQQQHRSNYRCNACLFPFYTCHSLLSMVEESPAESHEMIQDAKKVIMDTKEKFKLYMAHVCRKRSQSLQIDKKYDECKRICEESRGKIIKAVVIMDFKMKYESKSSRESSVEHFGKRGMGWHGIALTFFLWETNEAGESSAVKYLVFIDQVIQDGNKQDAFAVLSLLEAAMNVIHMELPYICELILQSDNAATYQNHFIKLGIHLLNCHFYDKLFISEYIHTETQDGKTILDGHFGTCVIHLNGFMKLWMPNKVTKIKTPNGLGYALAYDGGVTNTIVQLVNIDRSCLQKIRDKLNPSVEKLKLYMSRVNQIYYNKPRMINQQVNDDVFNFEAAAFTGITRKVTFYIDISKGTASPDEISLARINAMMGSVDDIVSTNNGTGVCTNVEDGGGELSESENIQYSFRRRTNRTNSEDPDVAYLCNDEEDSDESYSSDQESLSELEDMDENIERETSSLRKWENVEDIPQYDSAMCYTAVEVIKQLPLGVPKQHVQSVRDKSKNQRKFVISRNGNTRNDSISKAIRYAATVVNNSNYYVDCKNGSNPMYENSTSYTLPQEDVLLPGWALRGKRGDLYGYSYVKDYTEDLQQMFQKGVENSSNKMNAGQMREALKIKYPWKFSIPGETEIKSHIGAQFQKSKYKKQSDDSGRGRRANFEKPRWHSLVETLVEHEPNSKPEDIYKKFEETIQQDQQQELYNDVPLNNCEIDKKQIKQKISQHRQKLRKEAMMYTLYC